jgi:hypothetical protein
MELTEPHPTQFNRDLETCFTRCHYRIVGHHSSHSLIASVSTLCIIPQPGPWLRQGDVPSPVLGRGLGLG